MVEGARLESVYTRKGIAGSNPALSALNKDQFIRQGEEYFTFDFLRHFASQWLIDQMLNSCVIMLTQ